MDQNKVTTPTTPTEPIEVRIVKLAMAFRIEAHRLRDLGDKSDDAVTESAFRCAAAAYEVAAGWTERLLSSGAEEGGDQ